MFLHYTIFGFTSRSLSLLRVYQLQSKKIFFNLIKSNHKYGACPSSALHEQNFFSFNRVTPRISDDDASYFMHMRNNEKTQLQFLFCSHESNNKFRQFNVIPIASP